MPSDTVVTFRLPSELKRRVVEIAEETKRSMSQVFILLLEKGIEAYEEDGYLIDIKPRPKREEPAEESAPAKKITASRK